MSNRDASRTPIEDVVRASSYKPLVGAYRSTFHSGTASTRRSNRNLHARPIGNHPKVLTKFVAEGLIVATLGLGSAALTAAPAEETGSPTVLAVHPSDTAAAILLDETTVAIDFQNMMGHAYAGTAPSPLNVDGIPLVTHYEPGDVGYWSETNTVYVFTSAGSAVPEPGFSLLGRVTDAGLTVLQDEASAKVDLVVDPSKESR